MRYLSFGLIGVLLLAGGVTAQVADGDIVVGQFRDSTVANSYGPGSLFSVNPSTGKVFVIASKFTTVGTVKMGPNWVEMASDNKGFMVGLLNYNSGYPGPYFLSVDAQGNTIKTLMSGNVSYDGLLNSFDLDGDGCWIITTYYRLYCYDENTQTGKSLWYNTSAGSLNAIAIDRAPGGPDYAIEFPHGYTYSAHPLACAAALASLDIFEKDDMPAKVRALAPHFENALHGLKQLPFVTDIRNLGLAGAIQIEPYPGEPARRPFELSLALWEKGFYVRCGGDTLQFAPPYISTPEEIDRVFAATAEVLEAAA